MAGFESLYLAQFVVQAGTAAYQNQQANVQAAEQRQASYRQVALNNQLALNAHTNLNQQQSLELKKFGFDKFELQKSIRRERASNAAIKASFGGSFGQEGGSFISAQQNINRHGLNALARKDLNFKTTLVNLETRRKNISLENLSKNNAATTGLSTGGSLFGTGLSILSSGIDIAQKSQAGTQSINGN